MANEEKVGTMTFQQKLLVLYERFAYVQKTGKNEHFRYRFMQESVMKRKLNEACRELGLIIGATEVTPVGECTGKVAVVKFSMRLENADCPLGLEYVILEGIGGGMDTGDKAPMKAVVSAMKYAIANGLMVETGDDPEADASTDDAAVEAVRARIASAPDRASLEFVKVDLAALKGCDAHDELKAAFKARAKELSA
jgi:hypothetical protein